MSGKNDYTKEIMGEDYGKSDDNETFTMGNVSDKEDVNKVAPKGEEPQYEVIDDEEETEEETVGDDEPKYTKTQVQKLIQTRLKNTNKRTESLKKYQSAVKEMSSLLKMTENAFLDRVTHMSPEEQAQILGVDEEQVPQVAAERQAHKNKEIEVSLQRRLEKAEMKSNKAFDDMDLYEEDIDTLLEENPTLSLKQAYIIVKNEIASTSIERDTEQRVRANRVKASQKGLVTNALSSGSGASGKVRIPAKVVAQAKQIGMDPVEYFQYSQMNSIDDYRNSRKGR